MSVKTINYGQISIDAETGKKLEQIFSKTGEDKEFEMALYTESNGTKKGLLNMETFLTVIEYLKNRSKIKKEKLVNTTELDIIYSGTVNYRLTLSNLETIQQFIFNIGGKRNHIIFKTLLNKYLNKDKNIKLEKKNRLDVLDIDDYGIRTKLATEDSNYSKKELDMLKNIDERDMSKIIIRYKQRVSLIVEETKNSILRVDVTNVKQTTNLKNLENVTSNYEVEVEYIGKNNKEYLQKMMTEIEILLKVINQSNFIVSTTKKNYVLDNYNKLFEQLNEKKVMLDGRKPISLELIHLLDTLPNKYAVTDKADGDRYFLIIIQKNVYLISNNLAVKDTGIELSNTKYDGSVLDGEYIFLPKHNRHVFLAFDCLFIANKDIREESSYMERIKSADEIITNCFVLKGEKPLIHKDYNGKFDTDRIVEHYTEEIKKFNSYLNNVIPKDKKFPLVLRKVIIPALGGKDNEIYKYANVIWKKYVFDKSVNCPYILDGVIFSPLDQKYITSVKNTKYFDYKMKPPSKNSIDMYITFERDPDTGKILTVFDNSKDDNSKGMPYKIINLYVGKQTREGEKPILFQEKSRKYIAHLYLKNGEVRDETGAIIKDKTVVEFYYNNKSGLDDTNRWIPMRTRYDKTEIVQKYKKGYGNYYTVASKVWRSIINPITFIDIEILSDDTKFKKHFEFLKGRIDHSLILSEKKENLFNQIRRNLAKPMRNFHNWIRSILIYTYCNQVYEKGNKLTILDIGCGKGEDIMKFYYVMCKYYVGIDIDAESLLSAADGAVSRYQQLRKTHANFPKYTFITADAGAPLDIDSQEKALSSMSQDNKKLMDNYFSSTEAKRTKFDRITSQDSIQFMLKDENTWNNFTDNINNYLKEGGYFIVTCFDADKVKESLKENDKYTSYYNTDKGEKRILFELIKKYDDSSKTKFGNSIDLHSFEEQEGVYVTQYLVDKEFLVSELEKKCNLELVETDLYSEQFNVHSDYFKYIYKYEENEKTREFFRKVAEFYDQGLSVNQACFKLTKLYRLYVFRKKEKSIKAQKGGNKVLNELYEDLYTSQLKESNSYSFLNSITESLKNDKIIPSSANSIELFGKYYSPDNVLDSKLINKILRKVKISHLENEQEKVIVDGLSVNVLEHDCNNDLEVSKYGLKRNKKAVYLYKNEKGYSVVYNSKNKSFIKTKIADDINDKY